MVSSPRDFGASGKTTMTRNVSAYISAEDVARSVIGEVQERNGTEVFHGHVIGFPQRRIALNQHEEHFETVLSRPALNSYDKAGVRRRSILSFGILDGVQVGRLYLRNTIKSVFLRPYKFITLTIVCSDQPTIYRADQTDRLHFSIGLHEQAFDILAEIVRLKQMCSVKIPTPLWKGPSLNYAAVDMGDKTYGGEITVSSSNEDALDFSLDELTEAAYGV
jgi:hypothetical protein